METLASRYMHASREFLDEYQSLVGHHIVQSEREMMAQLLRARFFATMQECYDYAESMARTLRIKVERARRNKKKTSSASRRILEMHFKRNAYPSEADKASLAELTGMNPKSIVVWFTNKRVRNRRDS